MQYCDLPQLPGRKPFGGQILSHDFVEAALLLRENWQVWLAYDLEGSYEEAPQALIENAQRDRRWCQGNLQHGLVLFAQGPARRQPAAPDPGHLRLSCRPALAGVPAHVQLDFLRIRNSPASRPSPCSVHCWATGAGSGTAQAFLIFLICMVVIMLPKVLALIDLAQRLAAPPVRSAAWRARRPAWSAKPFFPRCTRRCTCSGTRGSSLTNLLGISVGWATQKRSADGTTWLYAAQRHWGHTLIGVLWGAFMWQLDPTLFWWFTPVLAGMVLSIPLSVLTSRRSLGARARRLGLVSHAGRNPAAAGIDLAARTLEDSRTHRRHRAAPAARRPGRGHPRSLRQRHPRFAAAREAAQPGLCRTIFPARRGRRAGSARWAKNCWPKGRTH